MQVEREGQLSSGARVSNTWVIFPRAGDNIPKGVLIPHKTTTSREVEVKAGDRKTLHLRMSPRPIMVVGRVTAYQAEDG